MELFDRERRQLGVAPSMQTFEREQPWSAESQAFDWNQAAANQWSERQAGLRAQADDPMEMVRAAAMRHARMPQAQGANRRAWLGQQPEFREWMPAEIDVAHKTIWGDSPQDEQEAEYKRAAAMQQSLLARQRGIESGMGYNPMQGALNYDPRNQTASFPQEDKWDASQNAFIPQPAKNYPMPQSLYEQTISDMERLGIYDRRNAPGIVPRMNIPQDERDDFAFLKGDAPPFDPMEAKRRRLLELESRR